MANAGHREYIAGRIYYQCGGIVCADDCNGVSKKVNTSAAFWSMTLALLTVIGWYVASAMNLASVFSIDPLWPGLIVSIAVFTGISLVTSAQE